MREGALIRERMRIRLTRDGLWSWDDKTIRVPEGAVGTIARWLPIPEAKDGRLLTWNTGCAIQFDDYRHPHFNSFPLSRHDMGWDVLPEFLEAV